MPKHIAITQMVRSDCIALFETALDEFARRSLAEHGTLDVYCLRPPPGSDSQKYGSFAVLRARRTAALSINPPFTGNGLLGSSR